MATLNIGGQRVTVGDEFLNLSPEEQNATVDEIATSLTGQGGDPNQRVGGAFEAIQNAPAPQPGQTGILEDVARSAATGLRSGAEQTVGTLGDLNKLQSDLYGFLGKKFGNSPETEQLARELAQTFPLFGANVPSTEDVQAVTNPIIGEPREPQTTAGKFARSIGEFAPAAIAPGGLARKAATVAIPAVASEAGGQLTEGTAAEPFARLGGALLGGALVIGRPQARALKNAAKNAPTPEALKDATNQLYQTLRDSGVKYDRKAYGNMILKIRAQLRKSGRRRNSDPEVFAVIQDLAEDFQSGNVPDFDDINGMVQNLGEKIRGAGRDNPALANALGVIRDGLDDFELSAPLTNTAGMSRGTINELRSAARQTALKNIKQRALDRIAESADLTVAGEEAGIRNGILKMLRSKKGERLFKGQERDALLQVAKGRKPLQTLSRFGFDLGSMQGNASFLPTLGAIGAGSAFGPAAGAGLALAGSAAKSASPRLTNRALDQTAAAIRGGKLNDPDFTQALQKTIEDRRARALVVGGVGANTSARGGQ